MILSKRSLGSQHLLLSRARILREAWEVHVVAISPCLFLYTHTKCTLMHTHAYVNTHAHMH